MRLAGFALVAAACSGPGVERAAEPTPVAETDPMSPWKALKIRGRDYEAKLASIPVEQRREMAIAFLRDRKFACHALEMKGPCGEVELRLVPVVPGADLEDGCLRREIALWALDQIDGDALETELPETAREMARSPIPEDELPRRVIEMVDEPALLAELIGIANRAGHHDVADAAITRVDEEQLADLAFMYRVDAAYEALIGAGTLDEDRAKVDRGALELRRETRLRLIAFWAERAADNREATWQIRRLVDDCATALAALAATGDDSWLLDPPERICVALTRWGAESPELRSHVSPDGLDVQMHKDNPHDDGKDVVWNQHLANDGKFRMPFADELLKVLPECGKSECTVPGTTIRFRLGFSGDRLESIERYERLGGC